MNLRLLHMLVYILISVLLRQVSTEMTIYKKITSKERFRLSLLQFLSPHYFHNILINQTQYKCLTISPTILLDSPKKFNPKTEKIDYSIAQNYLKSLEGLCVQHHTLAFIYQYCHGGVARQFDDEITKYNNQKKLFENFVLGVTENSQSNQNYAKSINLPLKANSNQRYFTPPNNLKIIDPSENTTQCYDWFYSYEQSIISFKNPQYLDPQRLQLYIVSCEKIIQNKSINFKLLGKAMSPFEMLVTDRIIPLFSNLQYLKQNISISRFNSKDCLNVKKVHKYSTIPVSNLNQKNQVYSKLKKQSIFEKEEEKLVGQSFNLFDPTSTITNQKLYFQKYKKLNYFKTLHLEKNFLFGDFLAHCRYWVNQPDPFKVISFKIMPGSIIFLDVFVKDQQNKSRVLSLTVEQLIAKQILKVKINQLQQNSDLLNIISGQVAIRKCYILSNIQLKLKKVDPYVNFEKWGKLIKYSGPDKKNITGKVYLCNNFFKIQVGNNVLMDHIYQGYSKYNFNEEKYLTGLSLEKSCIQAQKIQQVKKNIKVYKIKNSPNDMQLLSFEGQEMNIDLNNESIQAYAIDMTSGTKIILQITDQQNKEVSSYLILYKDIYEIEKKCSKSKPNCTKIQQRVYLVKENSFYENQTQATSKTVYIKIIDNPIIKEHSYIGIWRSGDAEALPRFQLKSKKGKLTLKSGMAFIRVINKQPSKSIISKSVLDDISQGSMSLQKLQGALITQTKLKGGEICGPNRIAREVIVKFKCGEPLFKLIIVKQTAVCKYQYIIQTNKLCSAGLVKNYESSLFSKRQTVCTAQAN